MTKWTAVFIGFILTILVKIYFGYYEFIGLLAVGFITGFIARDGVFSGLWNGALAGALGTIITTILFILMATFGGSFVSTFGGMTGFTISDIASLKSIIGNLIYYVIVMGITGAVGGAISSRK